MMEHSYARSVTFYVRRFRMVLRIWKKDTWRIGVTFDDADEARRLEIEGFEDPISAVNSLGAYVDELLGGARGITRLKVNCAMEG